MSNTLTPGTLRLKLFICALACLALAGCASYQAKTAGTVSALQSGSPEAALAQLERNNTSANKDLLYYLEKGELLRMNGQLETSRDTWLSADQKIREWEDAVKANPSKVWGEVGAYLVNDTTRRYDGRDYEKVFVSVRLALDHLGLGDWDSARVEIKKMHEREAVIAEFRSKELNAVKADAQKKGLQTTSFKEINGYPVETLDAPEVAALKNAYESAFANYLAGFVYEALGEPSLASAGYNNAIAMRKDAKILQDGLAGLDARISKLRTGNSNSVDTLIVVETGTAPSIESITIPIFLPIPSSNGFINLIATPLSWPVIRASDNQFIPASVDVDGTSMPVALLTSTDQMARRALRDEMPGIIVRSSVRAISRGIAQKAIDDKANQNNNLAASLLSLATKVTAVVTETADTRGWRTLPGHFSVARVTLPQGSHRFTLHTAAGMQTREFELSGPYAVVDLRTSGSSLYAVQTPYKPVELAAAVVEPPQSIIPSKAPAAAVAKATATKTATAKTAAKAEKPATNVSTPINTTTKQPAKPQ